VAADPGIFAVAGAGSSGPERDRSAAAKCGEPEQTAHKRTPAAWEQGGDNAARGTREDEVPVAGPGSPPPPRKLVRSVIGSPTGVPVTASPDPNYVRAAGDDDVAVDQLAHRHRGHPAARHTESANVARWL
jgi:hypothetical protein